MALTQKTLQSILARIFSLDPDYVVPKQGNWWNPQKDSGGPRNWIAFSKQDSTPKVDPYPLSVDPNQPPVYMALKVSEVSLQIIGPAAEEMAESIQFWSKRVDVNQLFLSVGASLFTGGLGRVYPMNVPQSGGNDVMAYNVTFRVQWYNTIQTQNTQVTQADVTGSLVIN